MPPAGEGRVHSRLMRVCPACSTENPEHARFCLACGSPLDGAEATARGEERKVVSVLFADLVGFTAASDLADPEEVLATLRPYHALLRSEIERYGGTVEKFIGDAVMAVFGAPVAHEDDAERAVRAGLRIVEALAELNTQRGTDLAVRVLDDPARRVAGQAGGEGQGQLAAARLVEQAGRQPGADGVQLQLGDQPLQAEDQPAVGGGGPPRAVVGDELTVLGISKVP